MIIISKSCGVTLFQGVDGYFIDYGDGCPEFASVWEGEAERMYNREVKSLQESLREEQTSVRMWA